LVSRVTQIAPAEEALTVDEIFRRHATFAWRVLRRLGVPESDVDDVCQEVFVTVHRRLPDFEGRSSTSTWVYGICVRAASDYRKRGRVRHEITSPRPPERTIAAPQETDVALRQARELLDGILEELDEDKRAVFVLYEIEELGMTDVAAAVGCPLQTAYSRLHAARREVEAALARTREEER
jgi:RNA polymerase sigma-70 factor (ECF subfamily)